MTQSITKRIVLPLCLLLLLVGLEMSGGRQLQTHTAYAATTSQELVWPLYATTTPDYEIDARHKLSSTYGPRLQGSQGDRYDWHRGIDIPADCNTNVHAVADGTITKAGDVSGYSDRMVQIRHAKAGGGTYYSNYMHLASTTVTAGITVTQGTLIGTTGESEIGSSGVCTPGYNPGEGNGFDHLHFEIRDGGLRQEHTSHPLAFLPYSDNAHPQITSQSAYISATGELVVNAQINMQTAALDLNEVEVTVIEQAPGGDMEVDQEVFDMLQWNRDYTPFVNGSTNTAILDTKPAYDGVYDGDYGAGTVSPAPLGVTLVPAKFNGSSASYGLTVQFWSLNGGSGTNPVLIQVRAIDLHGNATTATLTLAPWQ